MAAVEDELCTDGTEHEWVLWNDTERSTLILDCNVCHQILHTQTMVSPMLDIAMLPVKVDTYGSKELSLTPRKES